MGKITLEDILLECQKRNWKCLDKEYKNLKTEMHFICKEGHSITSSWEKIRKDFKCPICANHIQKKILKTAIIPKTGVHRVLALDQSSQKTGYALYDGETLIKYGIFETTKNSPYERMKDFCDWLDSAIAMWQPDEVGIEETLYNAKFEEDNDGIANHDVFRLLTQFMGAAMITILRTKSKLSIVKISSWRKHCGVKGKTRIDKKRSAQYLVEQWFDIKASDDECDAICIGKFLVDQNSQFIIGDFDW